MVHEPREHGFGGRGGGCVGVEERGGLAIGRGSGVLQRLLLRALGEGRKLVFEFQARVAKWV